MTAHLSLTPGCRPDGAPVLLVAGEVDMSNSAQFAEAIEQALAPEAGPLTVDLTRVEYLDSAGLSVLFAHAEGIEVLSSPLLLPLLALSGLVDLADVRQPGSSPEAD